jgi:hypothetical protein
VNSEELEISLRTEFENYLKDALADMRQEVSQIQEKVETELDKHKSQLDVVFQNAFNLLNGEKEIDAGFKESVIEHLRLARDEGARITATAMAEAEKLDDGKVVIKDNSEEVARKFRDAVSEISSKTSQAEILKSLVRHAEDFAPRGAFFIIKNEHFVGWRTFGKDKPENDDVIREIFFPVASESLIGDSIRMNTSRLLTFPKGEDAELYLDKIGYEEPINQVAIPLVVRGRGVAALYADGAAVNVEALETLVRIASLTVELLASSRGSAPKQSPVIAPLAAGIPANYKEEVKPQTEETYKPAEVEETFTPKESVEEETYKPVEVEETSDIPVEYSEDFYKTAEISKQVEDAKPFESVETFEPAETFEPVKESDYTYGEQSFTVDDSIETVSHTAAVEETAKDFESENWGKPKVGIDEYTSNFKTDESIVTDDFEVIPSPSFPTEEYKFETKSDSYDFETPKTDEYQFETPKIETFEDYQFETPKTEVSEDYSTAPAFAKEEFQPAQFEKPTDFSGYDFNAPAIETPPVIETPVVETPVAPVVTEPASANTKPRFSDRNVDLPIDVAEDERRLHNDARRFARLLVSEIKLYNEQKVKEGRESSDLYDRLKEAIDRSREMYDKRVQPPVAAKFDYFNYELVNTLAEGDEPKLGSNYPGSTV